MKGIYDYFEEHLGHSKTRQSHKEGPGSEDEYTERKYNPHGNTRSWLKSIPKSGHASVRLIQRLPTHKIEKILELVRVHGFELNKPDTVDGE